MKNFTKISILIFFIASVMACKKDNTVVTPVEVCKVSLLTNTDKANEITTEQYEYNSDGKVSKITYKDGRYAVIDYSSTAMVVSITDKNNKKASYSYTLNAAGYVTKGPVSVYLNYGDAIYEYNSDGYLIKTSYQDLNGNTTYSYTDGNLTSSTVTGITITYEYYTDKLNNLGSNGGIFKAFGQNLYGKPSKNLVKKFTYTSSGQSLIGNYTYAFDSKGNVVQEIFKYSSGETNKIDLVYQCK
jgi:hypothetical protein